MQVAYLDIGSLALHGSLEAVEKLDFQSLKDTRIINFIYTLFYFFSSGLVFTILPMRIWKIAHQLTPVNP